LHQRVAAAFARLVGSPDTYTTWQAKKRYKRSWKDVFEYRKRLDDDWRTGAYSRVVTLVGHESQVCCCQYDDEKIISGSFDATVKGATRFVLLPPSYIALTHLHHRASSAAVWDIRNLEDKEEIKAVMALNKEDTQHAHRDRVLCLMFKDDTLVTGGRYNLMINHLHYRHPARR
jgi:hypothetical protein